MRLLESCIFAIAQIEKADEKKLGKKAFADLKLTLTQLIGLYDSK
jgi:hypothetical protein